MSTGKHSLASFQASMAHAVMSPLGRGDTMRRENHGIAVELVKPNDRLSSAERLQIYNQQYWWRLLGSFGDDFRGLRAVLGVRKFDRLAAAYLTECGSTSWNLRDLGQHLCRYLGGHPELVAPHGTLALEMAAVEWARVVAFDGEQKPTIDAQQLAQRPAAQQCLALQPYITLLELEYPVDHMLRRLKHADGAQASNAVSGHLRPRPFRLTAKPARSAVCLAVHRCDLIVYYKRLESEAYRLLLALRDGKSLGGACEDVFAGSAEEPGKIAAKVQTWFAAWMSFGWLCER